jgi:hypothetical protein
VKSRFGMMLIAASLVMLASLYFLDSAGMGKPAPQATGSLHDLTITSKFISADFTPDGRRSTGKVVEVGPRSMYVRFDNSMEPSLISFDNPEWMDYITFEAKGGQPHSASEVEAEGKRRG